VRTCRARPRVRAREALVERQLPAYFQRQSVHDSTLKCYLKVGFGAWDAPRTALTAACSGSKPGHLANEGQPGVQDLSTRRNDENDRFCEFRIGLREWLALRHASPSGIPVSSRGNLVPGNQDTVSA